MSIHHSNPRPLESLPAVIMAGSNPYINTIKVACGDHAVWYLRENL